MLRDPARYDDVAHRARVKISWPNGARIAIWIVPNIEFYELARPKGEPKLTSGGQLHE